MAGVRVYVGGLPADISERELEDEVRPFAGAREKRARSKGERMGRPFLLSLPLLSLTRHPHSTTTHTQTVWQVWPDPQRLGRAQAAGLW